jgi:single-stranded DNA-binding protein
MKAVQVVGRLGQEIKLEQTTGGTDIINFDLAVDGYDYTEKAKKVDWISCTVAGKSASFLASYAHVGDTIVLTGELRVEKYTSKKWSDGDGNYAPMTKYTVSAQNVELISKKGRDEANAPLDAVGVSMNASRSMADDDF